MHKSCLEGIYSLNSAKDPLPLVFDSPHSGTAYPDDFDYACDRDLLEKAEDKYVDDLFATAPDHGAVLLAADFPRSYIDLNRAADDIDPDLLERKWPDPETFNPSNRAYAGIGLIRRLVKPGKTVYARNLTPEEIQQRIETYYRPYHDALQKLLDGAHYKFGQVWHVNCHSMPSAGKRLGAMGRVNPFPSPDFVLGDRDGTSCDLDFTHAMRDFLKGLGYKVSINDPYKGVELVEKYSAPAEGRHSIQIEICKALYLDEETYKKNKNYDRLKGDIDKLIAFCADYASSNLMPMAAD